MGKMIESKTRSCRKQDVIRAVCVLSQRSLRQENGADEGECEH